MPQIPKQGYESFKYEIASPDIQSGSYPEGDPRHYVAKITAALLPKSPPPTTKVEVDLARNIEVFVGNPLIPIVNNNPSRLAEAKMQALRAHLETIAANARDSDKKWVTGERLQAVIDHLSQNLIRDTIGVVTENSQIQCTAGGIPLPKLIPLSSAGKKLYPIALQLTDSKIIFTFETDLFAYAAANVSMEDADYLTDHSNDPDLRDIEVKGTLTIDFSYLSATDGQFEPEKPAIILDVNIRSLVDDICIIPKRELEPFIATGIPAPEIETRSFYRIIVDAIKSFFGAILDFLINRVFFRKKKSQEENVENEQDLLPRERSDTTSSFDTDAGLLGPESIHTTTRPHRKRDLLLGYRGFKLQSTESKSKPQDQARPAP